MDLSDVFDARDVDISDAAINAAQRAAKGRIRLLSTPYQYINAYGRWHKGPFALVVAANNLVLAKKKGLGGARVIVDIPILDFARYTSGLYSGGPLSEFYSELASGGTATFLFQTPGAADATAEYVNSGVALARG